MHSSGSGGSVAAWDLPTRIFHWALVLTVASAWASYEFSSELGDRTLVWHRWNGLAVLSLLIWRVLWGIFGSSTARFSSFVKGPLAAVGYARDLSQGRSPLYLGHNPLGALMVLALIGVLLVQGGFGLFAVDDNDLVGGPLHRLVEEETNTWATGWHARIFDYAILPLVAVHVAVNALYGLVKKEPLIPAMLSGRKPRAAYEDAPALEQPTNVLWRAFLCLVAAKLLLFGTIVLAGGRLL